MKKYLDRIFIYVYIIISTVILCMFNNIYVFCTIEILLVAAMFIILKLDIKHPLTLFFLIFTLYQIAFPIINYNGIVIFQKANLNTNYFLYNWIATVSLIVFWGDFKNVQYNKEQISSNINTKVIITVFVLSMVVLVVSNIFILTRQFSNKYELLESNSLIISIGRMVYVAISPLMLYLLMDKNLSSKKKIVIVAITFIMLLIGSVTFKERDYLFNFIVVMLLYYFTINKISIKKLIIFGAICVVIFAISPMLKTITNTNTTTTTKSNSNIILDFLNSDFAAAGFNFNYLLNNYDDRKNGSTYIFDFLSPVDMVIPGVEDYSVTKWYQNTYWSTRKTGLGFSIIGEGYVNFGLFGIILQMMILSRLIKFIYTKSNINIYWYVIYLSIMPLCMYACRGSLANIISPGIKYHVALAIFVYIISNMRRKKQNE